MAQLQILWLIMALVCEKLLNTSIHLTCVCLGLPLAIALAFWAKWNAIGLWIGIVSGEVVVAVLFVVRLLRLDWKERADHAQAMLHQSHPMKTEEESTGELDIRAEELFLFESI